MRRGDFRPPGVNPDFRALLILLDQPANLLIDFMRNVIRATPA
jgi:hypothetical protein